MQPQQYLAQLLAESEQHQTPCGSGMLQWQQWSAMGGERPLILLHGGYGSWTHWVANIPELRKSRTLWSLDLPGLGDSADLPVPHTTTHCAAVVLQGINQLLGPTQEFDLAGFSFGAMVAAAVAEQAGNRCKHLVASGAAGCGKLHVQVQLQRPPGPGVPADEARAIHRANLRSLMFASNESIDELSLHVHAENLARARFNSRRLSLSDEFCKLLPSISADLIGIWGSRDATAGGLGNIEERRLLLQRTQPDAQLHILKGVGHWAMYEDAQAFNRLLIEEL